MLRYPIVGGLVAALLFLFPATAVALPSPTPFAIEPGSFAVTPSTLQAGGHPDLTIAFDLAHSADDRPFNDVKDTVVNLPPGFVGAASAAPTCTDSQLLVNEEENKPKCPLDSQIGTITADFTIASALAEPARMTLPIFNMAPSGQGAPAELGFRAFVFSQLVPMSIRPEDGGLTISVPDVPLAAEIRAVSITIWGVPAAPGHDAQRGQECLPENLLEGEESCVGGGNPATVAERPFLYNPTRCGAATAGIEADSWEEPERWSRAEAEAGPIAGCEHVPFAPSIEARPSSDVAEAPTGLDLSVTVPQSPDEGEAVAASSLGAATVALPEGMTINPASANGLGVCTHEELERETASPAVGRGCPAESKLGTVEIETPLLGETALGSIYMAKPFDAPSGSRFGLYVLARAPTSGVVVELAGRLAPDEGSGRLLVSFDDIPQLPLSHLALHLGLGPRTLLVNPPACGPYAVQADLTPASGPGAPRRVADSFAIARGARGGACPGAGPPPFHPDLSAGSLNPAAGAFSPFFARLRREDGEAQLGGFSLRLPPGLVAGLRGIPLCPDAALAAARAKTGAGERAEPSCPALSEIGHAQLGAGVGSELAWVGGEAYLAGPYRGAPLSLALVVPALLGPFDLGTAVVREALRVDRRSGGIVLGWPGSDPIPRILDGVPLRLRDLRLDLDRPQFLRNPTSCGPAAVQGTVTGVRGVAGGGAETAVALRERFQVSGCAALRFAPRLHLRVRGGVRRNGHPALRVVLAQARRGEAGLAAAAIELPHTELLDPGHVHDVCTRERFAERRCPPGSAVGFARAFTPLLSGPLKGPVYLRATERGLPSLATALHSPGMDLDLSGRLEAVRGGVRIALEGVPDAPISKLVLEMRGGKRGLLVNSRDLCAARRRASVQLTAHNGRAEDFEARLSGGCAK